MAQYEVFDPAFGADARAGDTVDIASILMVESAHELFRDVEQKALHDAEPLRDLSQEVLSSLGALPLERLLYTVRDDRLEAAVVSTQNHEFMSADEWGVPAEFRITTSLAIRSQRNPATRDNFDDIHEATGMLHRVKADATSGDLLDGQSKKRALLNVAGEPIRSKYLRRTRGYAYDEGKQKELGSQLGGVLLDDARAGAGFSLIGRVDIVRPGKDSYSFTPAVQVLDAPALYIKRQMREFQQPTPVEKLPAHLRVLSELIRRSDHIY